MGLFKIHGNSEDDPGTRFFIGKDVETNTPCYIWVRRVPADIVERIESEVPGKVVKPRGGGAPFRKRTEKEQALIAYKKIAWALAKLEGPAFTPEDEEAVRLFRKWTGGDVQRGRAVTFNGDLGEEAKIFLLRKTPELVDKIGEKLAAISNALEDDEELETRNLSTGSSGESPRSSQE